MTKILLISPPSLPYDLYSHPNYRSKPGIYTEVPIGILSLSSYLKSKISDVDVQYIDFNVELFKHNCDYGQLYLNHLSGLTHVPDFIGISVLFSTAYQNMEEIAKLCKTLYPKANIVVGGGIPTIFSQKIADNPYIDFVCKGEGERFFFNTITGNGSSNGTINNLDEIPRYDYDLININDYQLNPTVKYFPMVYRPPAVALMTSRGCPHQCTFCAAHQIRGRKMRFHSLERVWDELRYLKSIGVNTIVFQDDFMVAGKSRFLKIMEYMRGLNLIPFFQNALYIPALDTEILESIKDTGSKHLVLAIESGSDRVLQEIMHKKVTTKDIRRVTDECRRLGIYVDANVMGGLPGETKKDLSDSRKFLRSINVNWYRFHTFVPLPGSELYQICLDRGYIKKDSQYGTYKTSILETEFLTSDYVENYLYEMNLDLNFVNNSDMRLGNYETALYGFKNSLRVKPDHLLAKYYIEICKNYIKGS